MKTAFSRRRAASAAAILLACLLFASISCGKSSRKNAFEIGFTGAGGDSATTGALVWRDFSAQIVDRDMNPAPHTAGVIELEGRERGGKVQIGIASSAEKLPGDLFITLSYDASKWRYSRSEYKGAMGASAIALAALAVPGRLDVGVSKLASDRGGNSDFESDKGKAIYSFEFEPGAERSRRSVSDAPSGDSNKVDNLNAIDAGNGSVLLSWNERNTGDYDNNGTVGVPDITPIALHYLETEDSTGNLPLFRLIDGDGDGQIAVPDITPIALNYLNTVSGYMIYRSDMDGEPLPPGTASSPTALRPAPAPSQGRLAYEFFDVPPESGTYSYTVRPFSRETDANPLGTVSNEAVVDFQSGGGDNLPPVWDDAEGVTAAIAGSSSLLVEWGRAVDADTPPVTYLVYISEGDEVSFSAPDKLVTVPAGDPDDAEHSHQIWDLPEGTRFTVAVRARDGAIPPNVDSNVNTTTVELVESAGWLEFRGGPGRTGAQAQPLSPPLTLEFAYPVNPGAIQSRVSPAIVENPDTGRIYALCALDATLYCLDVTDKSNVTEEWKFTSGDFIESGIAVSAGRVYFGGRDKIMHCREVFTGDPVWTQGVDGTIASSAVIVDDVVYSATANSQLLILSALDGGIVGEYFAPATISSSPAVVDGKVFIGTGALSAPANIICFDTATNMEAWRAATPAGVPATPAVADGFVMAGDVAGNFHILTTLGAVLHTIPLDGAIHASASYADGVAYAATRNGKVYAIDAASGEFVWPAPASIPGINGVTASPVLTGGFLYVAAGNGKLYCFDAASGEKLWEEVPGSALQTIASPCVWRNVIYVQCGDNTLRAFKSNDDLVAPVWIDDIGIIAADWTGTPVNLILRLVAGDAYDEHTPPVRWRFYMSGGSAVDFVTPGSPTSNTITFAPSPERDLTLSAAQMNSARQRWTAHRAWYAARAMDSVIPPNIDGNTVVLDYTFPWSGFSTAVAAADGEKFYRFDGAYDEATDSTLLLAYTLDNGTWKIKQFALSESETSPIELLPSVAKASIGYVDVAAGNEQSEYNYYAAAIVAEAGSPVRRDLYLSVTNSPLVAFEDMVKIDSTGRNWGEVSVAVDDRGLPAVASTYWVDLTEPDYPTLYPQYHYIDDGIPPVWKREFIDEKDEPNWQTRYIQLAFKSDGTPIVAFTKSPMTTGNRTGLFVGERIGDGDWEVTAVADGAMLGTTGKHLSMILDENERPVIAFTDLEAELMMLALPVADGVWDVVQLGDLNNAGRLAHHETSLIRVSGAGPGDGTADYILAQFSTFGSNHDHQKVFIRAFGKSGGEWTLPPQNAYWLGEAFQPAPDSGSILAVPRGGMLSVFHAAGGGARYSVNEMRLDHLLK